MSVGALDFTVTAVFLPDAVPLFASDAKPSRRFPGGKSRGQMS